MHTCNDRIIRLEEEAAQTALGMDTDMQLLKVDVGHGAVNMC